MPWLVEREIYEMNDFEEVGGVPVPLETIETREIPARPRNVITATKMRNGVLTVSEDPNPPKEKTEGVAMDPARNWLSQYRLLNIEFHPKFTDEDFAITTPIPDGTRVHVGPVSSQTEEEQALRDPTKHVGYKWQDGKVVEFYVPVLKGRFDPWADAKAQIADAIKRAKQTGDHVLLIFGANDWQRCETVEWCCNRGRTPCSSCSTRTRVCLPTRSYWPI